VNIKISTKIKSSSGAKGYVQADFDYCTHEDFLVNNYTDFDYNYEKFEEQGKEYHPNFICPNRRFIEDHGEL